MKRSGIIKIIKELNNIPVNQGWLLSGRAAFRDFMKQNPVRNYEAARQSMVRAFFNKLILKPMPIAIIAMMASLLVGGGAVTASQNSLPTDILYPVKLVAEKVQAVATFDGMKKIELQTSLAAKRLNEIQELQKQGRATEAVVSATLKSYDDSLARARTYLVALNNSESSPAAVNFVAPSTELSKNVSPSPADTASSQSSAAGDKYVSPKVITAAVNLEAAVADQQTTLATIEAQAPAEYKLSLAASQKIAVDSSAQTLEQVGVVSRIRNALAVGGNTKPAAAFQASAQITAADSIAADRNSTLSVNASAAQSGSAVINRVGPREQQAISDSVSAGKKTGNGVIMREEKNQITSISIMPSKIVVDEAAALKIAAQAGLKNGLQAWTASLEWSDKVNNYVWTVSVRLSESSGQTVVIDASSGKVYGVSDYQVSDKTTGTGTATAPEVKAPPAGTVTAPSPDMKTSPVTPTSDSTNSSGEKNSDDTTFSGKTCPQWINCMPGPDRTAPCLVPPGCEGITEIAY
jgi:hypothetical protein